MPLFPPNERAFNFKTLPQEISRKVETQTATELASKEIKLKDDFSDLSNNEALEELMKIIKNQGLAYQSLLGFSFTTKDQILTLYFDRNPNGNVR